MSSKEKGKPISGTRLELKYCEHCGALWLREPGGDVYCANCRPQVADLPGPRKRPKRVTLPVRRSLADEADYKFGGDDDGMDFEAAGGAA